MQATPPLLGVPVPNGGYTGPRPGSTTTPNGSGSGSSTGAGAGAGPGAGAGAGLVCMAIATVAAQRVHCARYARDRYWGQCYMSGEDDSDGCCERANREFCLCMSPGGSGAVDEFCVTQLRQAKALGLFNISKHCPP